MGTERTGQPANANGDASQLNKDVDLLIKALKDKVIDLLGMGGYQR